MMLWDVMLHNDGCFNKLIIQVLSCLSCNLCLIIYSIMVYGTMHACMSIFIFIRTCNGMCVFLINYSIDLIIKPSGHEISLNVNGPSIPIPLIHVIKRAS